MHIELLRKTKGDKNVKNKKKIKMMVCRCLLIPQTIKKMAQ